VAARKRKRAKAKAKTEKDISGSDKIARVLGMLLVKEIENKTDQVPLLRSAGFEVSEIASMLRMTENHVKVADHLGRKKRKIQKNG
jgi:hypothetical protein